MTGNSGFKVFTLHAMAASASVNAQSFLVSRSCLMVAEAIMNVKNQSCIENKEF